MMANCNWIKYGKSRDEALGPDSISLLRVNKQEGIKDASRIVPLLGQGSETRVVIHTRFLNEHGTSSTWIALLDTLLVSRPGKDGLLSLDTVGLVEQHNAHTLCRTTHGMFEEDIVA